MKKFFVIWILSLPCQLQAQSVQDSIIELKEVIVRDLKKKKNEKRNFQHSLEKRLEPQQSVDFVRRGAFSFEPTLNNMTSERSIITIEGMRIFGACTDKMDPVTSYLESHNIQNINVLSGQDGSRYGVTIAGSIDLNLPQKTFSENPAWKHKFQTSYQSNNWERFTMITSDFSAKKLGANATISHRKADNYHDGNQQVIAYSQYEKTNFSANIHLKINPKNTLRSYTIFDIGSNIGFPSLDMDTPSAKGFITMLYHTYKPDNQPFELWENQFYYNTFSHTMGDNSRDEKDKLPIKMDMFGKSETFGGISKIRWKTTNFLQNLHLNVFQNRSDAQMIMYYQSGGYMFTYTWPDVITQSLHLSTENQWEISEKQKITFNASVNWQNNEVNSDVGYRLNQVFHQFERNKNRMLPSFNANYLWKNEHFSISAGMGFGKRSPSISEGYGFYLYNNSDGYDYIGNPNLENETSYDAHLKMEYLKKRWKINADTRFFYIENYIFGKPFGEPSWQMTPLGAKKRGLKMYQSLPYAKQFQFSVGISYQFSEFWLWKNHFGYAYGADYQENPLPFVRPPYYISAITFRKKNFSAEASLNSDFKQTRFSTAFGEDATPDYHLWNLSMQYEIPFDRYQIEFQIFAENIFNRNYTTYADWKNFPRMGRNFQLRIQFQF